MKKNIQKLFLVPGTSYEAVSGKTPPGDRWEDRNAWITESLVTGRVCRIAVSFSRMEMTCWCVLFFRRR